MNKPLTFLVLIVLALSVGVGSAAVVETELAGNSLGGYPHFEYVRAFNVDEPIEVAVDPLRFPSISGITADIYVVEAQATWVLGDPLVDAGIGAETRTFNGAEITGNIFQIVGGGELAGDAGVNIGVAYDVVIDVDQDGLLSDGDFLDAQSVTAAAAAEGADTASAGGGEAGLYVVKDVTTLGPLSTTCGDYTVTGVTPGFARQITCYPTQLVPPAFVGQFPLVVISHGNGHQYTWYDYIQRHLASHGYIVMSHQNNTGPGITTASTTTLEHTDAIIGQQATILGGVLNGHIDSSRMTWIGHSRGGEGIVTAFTRISIGDYIPSNYNINDIALMSSISPTDFADLFATFIADPEDTPYHIIYGSADGDVDGSPGLTCCQPFRILERADGFRQSTYVHGADHNDFNCCGFNDFRGPPGTEIGRTEAQQVLKGVTLPLVKHYIEGNIPGRDFLWRQYERFKPIGVSSETTVVSEYKESPVEGKFVLDDYQTAPGLSVSSSGGFVFSRVDSTDPLLEGLLADNNTDLTWTPTDPFNGMTRALTTDDTRGAVFGVGTGAGVNVMLWTVPAGSQDFSGFEYLSFRAAQGTRHPLTTGRQQDESWRVLLRDTSGNSSWIDFAVYGGGIEEPYQRTGSGSGAGWNNEFETVRIRLSDFLTGRLGMPTLDLTSIQLVGFVFIDDAGRTMARLGLDDLEMTVN
ncbi:MAG: hypothetical protein ACE5JX_07765 [Acidobacteriota bacterium]